MLRETITVNYLVCTDVVDEVDIVVTGCCSDQPRQTVLEDVDEVTQCIVVGPPERVWAEFCHLNESAVGRNHRANEMISYSNGDND